MILLCYDGSDDAKAAIGEASKLFSGQKATVLTVWQPFAEVLASTTLGCGARQRFARGVAARGQNGNRCAVSCPSKLA